MEEQTVSVSKRYLSFIFLMVINLLTTAWNNAFGQQDPFSQISHILSTGRPVITLGGGAAITSDLGRSQNFPIADPSSDEFYNYQANHANQTGGLFDIFIGGDWILCSPWSMQLGLDFSQIQVLTAKGTLIQGIDLASADQYSYRYSSISRQLLAEGKLFYQYKDRFYPYFLLGLGAAFNNAYHYSASTPSSITFTRQYSNHTQTSFSYAAGVGLDVAILPNWRVGMAYRFTDLGKVSLGSATINTIGVNGTLSQSHFYVNEIIAQLTWII